MNEQRTANPHGGRREGRPRRSILDSGHYPAMDLDDKLSALLREVGNRDRFHMDGKGSQNRVLRLLSREGPMTQRDLTARLGIQSGSASELLGKLERTGLILRTPSAADRRTVDVSLTRQGQAQAEQAAQARRQHRTEMFSALTGPEKMALLAILEKLARGWQQTAAQQPETAPDQPASK